MYIDFTFYIQNGGTVDNLTTFTNLERKSRLEIDLQTQCRLNTIDEIPINVKYAMVEMINILSENEDNKIKSFSNDGVSITYDNVKTKENKILDIIRRYVPQKYLYLGVDQ